MAGGVGLAVVVAILAGAPSPPSAQPRAKPDEFPCDVRTTERIVAVGDIHGAYDKFVAILRAAGLIDTRNRWSGGKAVLVQVGDVLDRGPDSRKAVDLLRKLEGEAQRAGGRVYALVGNHELMRLASDWRYVSPGELDAFKTVDSVDVRDRALAFYSDEAEREAKAAGRPFDLDAYREQFRKELPLGSLEMRFAFGPKGEYGPWVRARPTVARINGILFLHGGISDSAASLGCEGINLAVRADLLSLPIPLGQVPALFSSSDMGPLWYRGLALEPEETLGPTLETILQRMGARAIVIGHTTVLPGRIATRFGGRVIQIDSGMVDGEFYPGGVPSALEIQGDNLTAIYLDRRELLPAPALTAVPSTASSR